MGDCNVIDWVDFAEALSETDEDTRVQALLTLIERGGDVNSLECSRSVLMEAAEQGNIECVRILLEAGANVDITDHLEMTALMYAAERGHDKCVQVLIETGADVYCTDFVNRTALIHSVCDVKCIESLPETGAEVNHSITKDQTAILEGYVECTRLLLEAGVIADQFNDEEGFKATLLDATCNGNVGSVQTLLGADANNMDLFDDGGLGALVLSSCHQNTKSVQLFLDADAYLQYVDQSDIGGLTALMSATCHGHAGSMKLLLEAGANMNAVDFEKATAIIRSASSIACRVSMLKTNKIDIGEDCFLKLLVDCLKLLINAGADVNAQNNKNIQPIHYALKLWPDFKFPAEYLISENCNLSLASHDQVLKAFDSKVSLSEEDRLDILKLLFACGLPGHICQSFIAENDTPVRNWVETVAYQPNTLKSICVFKIRKRLGLGIKSKISKMNLPIVIKNLILLKNVLSSDCFI